MENSTKLYSWEELYDYTPIRQQDFYSPENSIDPKTGSKWKYLIHMIRSPDSALNKIHFEKPFEESVKNWDIFSTSLVSNEKTVTIGYFGFILDVPFQNILSTNDIDVGSQHHIGFDENGVCKGENAYKLADYINSKINKEIESPDTILERTGNMDWFVEKRYTYGTVYNEIILVGRPGTSIHRDVNIPLTDLIKVKGVYALTGHDSYAVYHNAAKKIAELNKVPVIYVKSSCKNGKGAFASI